MYNDQHCGITIKMIKHPAYPEIENSDSGTQRAGNNIYNEIK